MIEKLKKKVLKAQQDGDIASLYILEQQAQDTFDEKTLHGFYANILDLALERLTDVLEAKRVMQMDDVQDFATLRALYEYAIEHYSVGKFSDASALFEVLGGLSDDEDFSSSMKIHQKASAKSIDFDEFLQDFADIELTQKEGKFYITHWKKEAQDLLDVPKKDRDR